MVCSLGVRAWTGTGTRRRHARVVRPVLAGHVAPAHVGLPQWRVLARRAAWTRLGPRKVLFLSNTASALSRQARGEQVSPSEAIPPCCRDSHGLPPAGSWLFLHGAYPPCLVSRTLLFAVSAYQIVCSVRAGIVSCPCLPLPLKDALFAAMEDLLLEGLCRGGGFVRLRGHRSSPCQSGFRTGGVKTPARACKKCEGGGA